MAAYIGEGTEQGEHSITAGGSANLCFANQYGSFSGGHILMEYTQPHISLFQPISILLVYRKETQKLCIEIYNEE